MRRLVLTAVAAAFGLSLVTTSGAFADDAEIKQRIIDNLKVTYEQLRDSPIVVSEMGPSTLGAGVQEGTLVIGGRQQQREERIVRAFEGEGAIVAERFEITCFLWHHREIGGEQRSIDIHGSA